MTKNKPIRFDSLLISGGLLLWAAAVFLTGYNIFDEKRAMNTVQNTLNSLQTITALDNSSDNSETAIPDYLKYPEMEMPVSELNGQLYIGILTLPTIDVDLPVISSWDYNKLKMAPCRYTGSVYMNTLVVAAHNYRSHFGRLGELDIGAPVIFTDADGNTFHYQVVELEVLAPTAVTDILSDDYDLTLFTCTVGGQNRLAVRCIQNEP